MRNALIAAALLVAAGSLLALAPPSAAFQARSPNGTWRCSAQGDIPIGLLTVSGGGYRFQAVRNTAWDPKSNDSLNGSGAVQTGGTRFNPTSGPLRTRLQATRGYFGETRSPYSGRYDYIDLFSGPEDAYVLRCHRP